MAEAIRFEGISKSFKKYGKRFFALRDVSFSVREGEIFALLGPNGSGKTTLIKILLTLLLPDAGRVYIFGKDPNEDRDILGRVNYTSTEGGWYPLKVRDVLLIFAKLYGMSNPQERVNQVMDELGLSEFAERIYYALSTGETQLVRFAKALINRPRLLIMDEPTFGLDPSYTAKIHTWLKRANQREGMTVFFTSHNMLEVERMAERVAFIKRGEIISTDRVSRVRRAYGSIERYWLRLGE